MSRTRNAGPFPNWRYGTLAGLIVLVGAITAADAVPPSGGSYVMQREVIAGGGQSVSGGTYILVGTVGQSAAQSASIGGTFQLASGFHTPRVPAVPLPDAVFRDGFE
ncbi:hypothetical protein C7S18_09635 [Ahniella affigens]|uniref:Uncharacterized protein n=1 Tax=Ahniella affigens TaxID=2021234 RepID=A0A2P1PRI2_9GAMM|nr:hypothetical protein [Ahniella affigens]AVP97441.1 hypothetical protein C7S18_09635 [Ahniella affigens]